MILHLDQMVWPRLVQRMIGGAFVPVARCNLLSQTIANEHAAWAERATRDEGKAEQGNGSEPAYEDRTVHRFTTTYPRPFPPVSSRKLKAC
jgi:hypothetical protein